METLRIKIPYSAEQIKQDPAVYLALLTKELENIFMRLSLQVKEVSDALDDHIAAP